MKKHDTNGADAVYALFRRYRDAYRAEWQRIEKCERLYRGDHWYDVPETEPGEPRPVTPVIQSTIENVRADMMDQYPEAVITADDPQYAAVAELLGSVIRDNHRRFRYEREYEKLIHDLLVSGYMVQEVGYDPGLDMGLGGSFIRHVDAGSVMFDPECAEVQDGRAIFKFASYPREWYQERYPDKAPFMEGDGFRAPRARDAELMREDGDAVLLIECWQREFDADSGRWNVRMRKFAGRQLLEDTRDMKPGGYYAHGQYPFIVTSLFPRRGSPLGYGFADMFENRQRYSDKLDQIILKNALMASRNKLLVTGASGFDPDDLRDWSRDVHRGENLNGVSWFQTAPLPGYMIQYVQSIREAIKEESGANDFSRGRVNSGVTAASAIAALREAASKRARMVVRSVHGAFAEAVRLEIEVEREFSVFTRRVAVTGGGETRLVPFTGDMLNYLSPYDNTLPLEFAVSVKAQKESEFSTAGHNETVLRLVETGMLPPSAGLRLMKFDGKEEALALAGEAETAGAEPAAAPGGALPAAPRAAG